MSDELKPIRCGCGGEARTELSGEPFAPWIVKCPICGIRTELHDTEAEAIETWNRAMGAKDINVPNKERTAKVVDLMFPIGTSLGIVGEPKIGRECLCASCIKLVHEGDDYCSHCGCRLEWE